MANINIPQAEAEDLIDMEKLYTGKPQRSYPGPGENLQMKCESLDGAEMFHLDVYRGRIALTKATHNMRVRTAVPLLRLDLNAAPHRNPDGEKVGRTHLHVYREGYGDAWAYEVPQQEFGDLTDLMRTLTDFMTYCNITQQPSINPYLF
jgi:hypothetical protein